MQAYSDPKRENDPYSLPNVEIFYVHKDEIMDIEGTVWEERKDINQSLEEFSEENQGWYYWHCLLGCLPDSDPVGPFETEEQALEAAQEDSWQFDLESSHLPEIPLTDEQDS